MSLQGEFLAEMARGTKEISKNPPCPPVALMIVGKVSLTKN